MTFDGIGRHLHRRARRRADRARGERRWAAAAAGYRRWLERRPGDGPIWVQLGHMLREDGDLAGADEAYRHAAVLMPDDADLLLFRGHLERERGHDDAALDLYRRSQAQDGNAEAARALEAMLADRPDAGGDDSREQGPDESNRERADEGEAAAPVEAIPAPSPAGAVEYLDHEVVHGWLSPTDDDDGVVFTAGGRVVGRAWPDRDQRRGEGHEFRTLLALDGMVEVHARRRSDGVELDGSPFLTQPLTQALPQRRRAQDARVAVVKPVELPARSEVALLVTHSATGAIKPHITAYARALHAQAIAVVLVVVADRPVDIVPELLAQAAKS